MAGTKPKKLTEAEVAAQIDIEALVPPPPDDLVAKVLEAARNSASYLKAFGRTQYLIYHSDWMFDPYLDKKVRCLHATCTACKQQFFMENWFEYTTGDMGSAKHSCVSFCPECGEKVVLRAFGKNRGGMTEEVKSLVFNKVGDKVVAVGYLLERYISQSGAESISVTESDAYVFGYERPVRFAKWWSGYMGRKEYGATHWHQSDRISDCWMGSGSCIYPVDESLFYGTCLANSHVVDFINTVRYTAPMKYCDVYLKYPGIENLLMQGFVGLVVEKVRGSHEINRAVDWKQVKPGKMLGLNREEMARCKNESWDGGMLLGYKLARQYGWEEGSPEMGAVWGVEALKLLKEAKASKVDAGRLLRYWMKQAAKLKDSIIHAKILWIDYRREGGVLGYDFTDDAVCWPPNLKRAHDRAVAARQYAEDEALREKFVAAYEQVAPLAWTDGKLLITPAACEKDLIVEGKCLGHCVGGYGKRHCNGEPIFFIRQVDDPETPYFTLQLSIASRSIYQNRGKKNCAPPLDVKQFADRWLEEVVGQYDFAKRCFKKVRKSAPKSGAKKCGKSGGQKARKVAAA